jgi:hypothetical protein
MKGHLLRCRCACFAKREERDIGSATGRREALSGPSGKQGARGKTSDVFAAPCIWRFPEQAQRTEYLPGFPGGRRTRGDA